MKNEELFNDQRLQRLFQYAFTMCQNRDNAYDLLHAAIEKFLQRDIVVDNVDAYLRTSIRNAWFDQQRSKKEFEQLSDATPIDITHNSLDSIITNQQDLSIIWQELSPNEREILYLWAVLGHTVSEIASELDTPRGTILARIHRMRKRIESKGLTNIGVQP